MFTILLLFGLILSPLAEAQLYSHETLGESAAWSDQMWNQPSSNKQQYELNDLYLTYSYTSEKEMAVDFAEQLCLDNYSYYVEIGVHAFDQDGLFKSFSRNSLLESLFQNQTFVNTLNRCLKDHNKSIEGVVVKALLASQLTRAVNLAAIGLGISAITKLFSALSNVVVKKTLKQAAKPKSKKSIKALFKDFGWFTLKTTPVIAGYTGFYMFNDAFKDHSVREQLISLIDEASPRYKCEQLAMAFEAKKQNYEAIYKEKKQQFTKTSQADQLELLEREYAIIQNMIAEEQIRMGNYYNSCGTLPAYN